MKPIHIKALTPLQKRKLMSGKKVRVKKPMKGGSINTLIIDPYKFNYVSRTFDKDKGFDLSMSVEELIATGEAEVAGDEVIQGSGIFGKKFDRWLKKKGVMKVIDKVAKPVKKVLFKAMDIGTEAGKQALLKNPKTAPLIAPLDYANRVAQSYIDKPTEFQKNYKKKLLKSAGETGTQMVKDVVEMATEGVNKAQEAQQQQSKDNIEGTGLYIGGASVIPFNGKYNYGDQIINGKSWINPNFQLRSTISPLYWKGMYRG